MNLQDDLVEPTAIHMHIYNLSLGIRNVSDGVYVSVSTPSGFPLLMFYPTLPMSSVAPGSFLPTVESNPLFPSVDSVATAAATTTITSTPDPTKAPTYVETSSLMEASNPVNDSRVLTPLTISVQPSMTPTDLTTASNQGVPSLFSGPVVNHPTNLCYMASYSYDAAIQVRHQILHQVEYYFSQDNLYHDLFLRSQMDNDGWVPVSLIATFKRIACLSSDLQEIIDVSSILIVYRIFYCDVAAFRFLWMNLFH